MLISEQSPGVYLVDLALDEQAKLKKMTHVNDANQSKRLAKLIKDGLWPPGVCASCSRRPG